MPAEAPVQYLSEIVGLKGVFAAIREMRHGQPLPETDVTACLDKSGVGSSKQILRELVEQGVIGKTGETYFVSSLGQKVWLLLSAINGADLNAVVGELSQMHPAFRPYELVTEGMTAEFIESLVRRPDFRRLYICSPWIHLKDKLLRKLTIALYKAQGLRRPSEKVEILVIARPLIKTAPAYSAFVETFRALRRLGAEIVVHPNLHTKLYIREPDLRGGLTVAVFGSENLTSKRNIELGIRITNDDTLIRRLISYYFELYARCEPYKEEN